MDVQQIVEAVLKEIQKSSARTEQQTMPTEHVEETLTLPLHDVDVANNAATLEHARSITPARIAIGRAGVRMKTKHYLHFRVDHAAAQDAVHQEVDEALLQELELPILSSAATDLKDYLINLQAGRKLSEDSVTWLRENGDVGKDVQIIVSNGLSSEAVTANIENLLPALMQGLQLQNVLVGKPIYVKRARVWLQDEVARIVNCKLAVILIGERPGLNTAQSLSAYMIYEPNDKTVEADRTVISNIHEGGLAPTEAGAYLAEMLSQMLKLQCSGVSFMKKRNEK
ncbi:MAG: ethanolamine ammonia-lyase subunit EutC [Lysinibacillus sp.]